MTSPITRRPDLTEKVFNNVEQMNEGDRKKECDQDQKKETGAVRQEALSTAGKKPAQKVVVLVLVCLCSGSSL